jgi:hypothetical protein
MHWTGPYSAVKLTERKCIKTCQILYLNRSRIYLSKSMVVYIFVKFGILRAVLRIRDVYPGS